MTNSPGIDSEERVTQIEITTVEGKRKHPLRTTKEIRTLLETLGAEGGKSRRMSRDPCNTIQNVEGLEAYFHCMEYQESCTKRPDKALKRRYVMCKRAGSHIGKWKTEEKKPLEEKGTAVCQEALSMADQALTGPKSLGLPRRT